MDNVISNIREGQYVKVVQKVSEGKKDRNVPFTGKVLKVRGAGANKTITVRNTLDGIEVDRIFSVASPTIVDMELVVVKEKKKAKKKTRSTKSTKNPKAKK